MSRAAHRLPLAALSLLLLLAAACAADDDAAPDAAADVTPDARVSDAPGPAVDAAPDAAADAAPDVAPDTPSAGDADADAGADVAPPAGLPTTLPFTLTRPPAGDPLTDDEVRAFTQRLVGFWAKVDYFGWLRDTSYGVHPSTGARDFSLWWTTVEVWKEDGAVVFGRLPDGEGGGGHNLMTRTSKVLAGNIAGHLLTGDERMARVAEQYCKGVTATMLGMVHGEDDPIDHLMARNVVPFDHEYTLPGDRRVVVDHASWRTPYDKWNCSRFRYPDNPTWGDIWVTNMRSKDDVSRVLKAAVYVRYAAERSPDEGVRAACGETWEYLRAFARDIVDSGYRIRTKDEDGHPFFPGGEGDPHPDLDRGDLGTYVAWEAAIPNAECNAKRAAALLGYGDGRGNDCGRAAGNAYEQFAVTTHYFNIWIIRSYHLSDVLQSLLHRENDAARTLIEGLVERYERDAAEDPGRFATTQDEWDRDLALSMMQAAAVGYPLTWEEARLVHRYVLRAVDEYLAWPYWDLWAPEIPDGRYDYRPPHRDRGEPGDEDDRFWIRPEDMATVLEICWSPFRNPDGVPFVDCDLVADPARWDPAWAE